MNSGNNQGLGFPPERYQPPPIVSLHGEQITVSQDQACFDSLKEEIKNIFKTVLALSSKKVEN